MKGIKKRLVLFAMITVLAAMPLTSVRAQAEVSEQTAESQASDSAEDTDDTAEGTDDSAEDTDNTAESTDDTAEDTESAAVKNGWEDDYYYQDGKAVNGWQKIDGCYYYFKKHKVQKNTIAGTKSTGYYYVGADGIRVDDPVINRAVKFVLKNSDKSDSQKERLQDCCKAIMKQYKYYHMSAATPKASEISGCAEYMLKKHKGNCYRFASTMCYVAIVLGYKARVAAGGVTRNSSASKLYAHGWCEIYINDKWTIWDLSM